MCLYPGSLEKMEVTMTRKTLNDKTYILYEDTLALERLRGDITKRIIEELTLDMENNKKGEVAGIKGRSQKS